MRTVVVSAVDSVAHHLPVFDSLHRPQQHQNIQRQAVTHPEQQCQFCHNEESNRLLAELMSKHGIDHKHPRIWFAQLKGMSDHISYNLAHAGYQVAKYLPYAPVRAMLPYLIRRAHENTSIAGQMSRELTLIVAERKRRKTGDR